MAPIGISAKVLSLIEATFFAATEKLSSDGGSVSVVNVQVDPEHGEVQLFGEGENESPRGRVVIFDWIKKNEDDERYRRRVSGLLKEVLSSMRNKRIFNRPCITRPFNVYLIDDEGAQLEVLLSLTEGEHTVHPEGHRPLLQGFERELDLFLEKLLPELK
ncbi:MAG: hypothetical protein LBB27_01335 [Tannerellaceae bacterium]|jgi:hypothetical protein|nr:hypothetical protein [Tannerellaceae bacterium]